MAADREGSRRAYLAPRVGIESAESFCMTRRHIVFLSELASTRAPSSAPGRAAWCAMTFSRYKALLAASITEVGGLAHAGRKFFDLHAANQSQLAQSATQRKSAVTNRPSLRPA